MIKITNPLDKAVSITSIRAEYQARTSTIACGVLVMSKAGRRRRLGAIQVQQRPVNVHRHAVQDALGHRLQLAGRASMRAW